MGLGSSYRSTCPGGPHAVFVWGWGWGKGPEWTLVRRAARHARFEGGAEAEEESAGSGYSVASGSEPSSPTGTTGGESMRRSSTRGSTAEGWCGTSPSRRPDATAWSTTAEVAHLDLERSQHVTGFGFSLTGARGGQSAQSPRWMPRAKLSLVRDPLAPSPRVVHLSAPNFADFDLVLDEEPDNLAPAPLSLSRTQSPRSSTSDEENTLAFSPTSFSSSSSSESATSSRSSYTSTSSRGGGGGITSAEPLRPTTVASCFPRGRPPPPPPPRRRRRMYTWRLVTEPDESSALVLLDRSARDVPAPVVARFAYAAREGARGAAGEELGTLEVYAKQPHRDDPDDPAAEEEEMGEADAGKWCEWELEVLIGTCELVCQYWRGMGRRFRGGVGSTGGYATGSASMTSSSSAGLSARAARGQSLRRARGPVMWDGGVDASWNDMY
jgi:hypothetical protein